MDPIYFEKTYYLGPDKGGDKAYRLLADAMAKAKRVALARFVMRGKESLVLIRPAQDGLMLHTMYFADEVRDFGEIDKGKSAKIQERRRGARPQADRRALDGRVQARAVPRRVPRARARPGEPEGRGQGDHDGDRRKLRGAQVIDLMEALKESLAKRAAGGAPRKPPVKVADKAGRPVAASLPRKAQGGKK